MITLNEFTIKPTIFPDGTSQIWKVDERAINESGPFEVYWRFDSEQEFLHLAQLKALLDEYNKPNSLFLPYLPYARQDKQIANNQTFALRVFAKLLNELNFDTVTCMDPHSDVAFGLIKNIVALYPWAMSRHAFIQTKSDIVCYPDRGALIKYGKVYDFHYVYGHKHRDSLSGLITSYELIGKVTDKSILIVDDICDGGMTFILLAKALKDAGAKEVHLFVSHGIFSKGLEPLLEAGIKRIFTKEREIT